MRFRILLLLLIFVASCAPLSNTTDEPGTLPPDTVVTSPPEDGISTNEPLMNPFAPKPDDEQLTRGTVFINEISLLIRESFPPQIAASVSGDLPTPCHALRAVIAQPDQENKIMIDLYSVVDPNKVCAQVLEPFEAQIELGTFPTGHYSVWVNDQMAGEFDS
jgi:hypothetical protein